MAMAEMSWPNGWAPNLMIAASQTGNRISEHPESAASELLRLQHNLPEIITQLHSLEQELLKMPDNGKGFGLASVQQAEAVRKSIAHLTTR